MKFKQDMSGQSTLEYMAVAVLVMVGILGMGPYVIRSVNAYFQGAQEQAQDSFREEMRQAALDPSEAALDMGEDCSCQWSPTYTCGDGIHCDVTVEMRSLLCTPASCKYEMGGVGAQCAERTLLEQGGRVDYHSAAGCFPLCTDAGNYSDCPTGSSLQTPDAIFGNCGYRCCEDALSVAPPLCGTGSHDGDQLMMRRCGPDLDEQYFWEPSLDQGCAAGDTACQQNAWRCMAQCSADEYLLAKADGSGCECSSPWVWDNSLNMCGCVAVYDGTAIGAGGSREYTSLVYPVQVRFRARVWTEDLNYCMYFYDEFGNEIVHYTGGGGCNGGDRDSDGDIDYSPWHEVWANQVYLKVKEGGSASSDDLGYSVSCTDRVN